MDTRLALALRPLITELIGNPELMGIQEASTASMTSDQREQFLHGEALYFLTREIGIESSNLLFSSQWGFETPEWYDHRHSWLNPDVWNHDFADSSVYNVLPKLPLGGSLLSLCCGDGFFEKHYYSKRCSNIVAVDRDLSANVHAKRLHSAPNIQYVHSDIFDLNFPPDCFDAVIMRSAIEHFTENQQNSLFTSIKTWLKQDGWFLGDTPANSCVDSSQKLLEHHEHEWSSEFEMRSELSRSFKEVHTSSLTSNEPTANGTRITLFWACK